MFAQHKLVFKNKYEEFINNMKDKTDLESQLRSAVESMKDVLPIESKCEYKNSEESNNLRKAADELFVAKKRGIGTLLETWETYSKSVAFAKSSSRELSQAYANRSAILFHLKKFSECVRDINRALELSYPDHLRANLLRRKAKCLKLLGKSNAGDVCEEARHWLNSIKLDNENKEELEKKIQIAMETDAIQTEELPQSRDNNAKLSLLKIKPHKKIPCASEAIDIQYNEKYKKYIVANRDINAGEILVIEKPYALLLKPERIYSHCSHCFLRAWDSIPCPNCVYAMYCSETCRHEAWKQYHDIECSIKGHLLSLSMNDLAPFSIKLAVLAVREVGSIEKLRQQLKDIDNCGGK